MPRTIPARRSRIDQTSARTTKRPRAGRGLFSLPFLAFLLLIVVPACSGSGCGSGCSCAGITPLPGGFVSSERIENGAAMRITSKGLQFLSQNLGAIAGKVAGGMTGTLEFAIPETPGSVSLGIGSLSYTVCKGGPSDTPKKCKIEGDLSNSNLNLSSQAPHDLVITGTIPVRLQDLPIKTDLGSLDVTITGNQACPGGTSTFADIGITADISVEADTDMAHARYGYSRIRITQLTISQGDLNNSIKFCNGGVLGFFASIFKSTIVGQLYGSLAGTLTTQVEQQLCQKANPAVNPTCPTGTNDVSGICRYGTDAASDCVSTVLGTDGHADLGGLLANLSPGTKGGLDFMLASGGQDKRDDNSNFAWGDLNPIGGGATLGFYGGVEPNPISGCVPLSNMARPTSIPIPAELLDDTLITNWPSATPGPHIGLGISQSFFNYAMNGLYNSGLLCIGVSTEAVPLLNSGTLGLLAGSLRDLGLQRETQPIAIVIRPSAPPKVTFGNGTNLDTDPLISLELNQASFDFYMFSSDRFVRFMTATFDIRAPINLTVTPDGLVPVLKTVDVKNGVVTNAELLKDDPAQIAGALQGLLSSQVGTLLGKGLPAFDINGPLKNLGLKLVIPPSVDGQGSPGLRKLEKNGETFLGVFASFETAAFQSNLIETSATLNDKYVDQAGLRSATINKDNAPEVTIYAKSPADDGTNQVEYQVRIDNGMWQPFVATRFIRLKEEAFRLEGKHMVEVRGRIVDEPYTLDPTPAQVEVIIDTVAPNVKASAVSDKGEVALDVFDLVSKTEGTTVRYRIDEGAWSSWMPAAEAKAIHVGEDAADIAFEARDEEGNIGTSQQELIRGLPHGASGSGCGCSVPTQNETSPWQLGIVGVGIAGIFTRLLSRRSASKAARVTKKSASVASKGPGAALVGSRRSEIMGAAIVLGVAGTYSGCSCDDSKPVSTYTCDPAQNCQTLQPGLIGSYTSTAVAGDKLWVAGYLEADYDNGYQYGDLVVGPWDGSKVAWTIVDGVPSDAVDGKSYNTEGFRGGQTGSGDDVGLWTSIAIDDKSQPAVAYYDRTHKQLKFAQFTGVSWAIKTVDGGNGIDAGRYAKLHFEGSTPVIAYMTIEPTATGFLKSKLRVARGTAGELASEDVVVNDQTPCRPAFCTGGSICVKDTGLCSTPASDCPAACAMGDSCVSDMGTSTCKTPISSDKLDAYPMGTGLYIATASLPGGGFGIAYYDRVKGSLNIAQQTGGAWTSTVVDGGDPSTPSDVGIGTSLFVDGAGDWHLTYVDGYGETVKYARVSGGKVASIETIDDGLQIGGVKFPDGQHVVGDDSFVSVTGSGEVHVTFQDATNGKLRYAIGTPSATGHDWKTKVVDAPAFGGFFSSQVELKGALQLVHWWRKGGDKTEGNVSLLSPP